jgi:predicted transposase/invertase (TIGR01784 family)
MQFINPTTDFAFKKIFGSPESADILLSFLNAVLGFKSPYRIAKVEIQDPYLAPKIKGMKDSFVDVRATDEQGKHYIIEMQVLPVKSFEQRVLYNACKKYAGQIGSGDDYRLLNDVIALTITDFIMFDHTEMVSKFKLRDESGRDYNDDLELIFVELPKFQKNEAELTDILDKWCYFLRYARKLTNIPVALGREGAIEHAFTIANRAQMSEEELELQERREMFIQDQRGMMEKASEDGQAKGEIIGQAKGEAIGARKKALDAARNFKALGLGNEQIALALGLSLEEVTNLKDD